MLSTYIVTACKGTTITDYNKRIFFRSRLYPAMCANILKGKDYHTFDACLKVGAEAETALSLDVESNKAFKSI